MNPDELIRWAARSAVWQLARRSPTWILLLIVAAALLYGDGGRRAHGAETRYCDMQGQCYAAEGGVPSPSKTPSKALPDPRVFDVRTTTRRDCDQSGCPPIGKLLPEDQAVVRHAPFSPNGETSPDDFSNEKSSPEPQGSPWATPVYDPSTTRQCAMLRQEIFLSLRALTMAHRLCRD